MYRNDSRWGRAGAALTAVGAQLAVLAVLIHGLAAHGERGRSLAPAVTTFDVSPPPRPESRAEQRDAAQGPAAPAAPAAEALPVEAPAALVSLAPEPAAPAAGAGSDASAGAADRGSGQGGGGAGSGSGAGGAGDGGGGIATPARRIAGALRDSDYPRDLEARRIGGTVRIAFRVRTDGRVDRCSVVESSGSPRLDTLTCRLFSERFRFRPAMTERGQPLESTLQTSFTWGTRGR